MQGTYSDFIWHWQKTRNWQKKLENKLKIYKNLQIKHEIFKNLEIKLEISSYFKLENKLEIFEFFLNGRWSQYYSDFICRWQKIEIDKRLEIKLEIYKKSQN